MLAIFGKVMDRVGYDTIVLFGYIAHTVTYLLVFYTVPDDATAKLRPTDDSYLIHQFEYVCMCVCFCVGVGGVSGWVRTYVFVAGTYVGLFLHIHIYSQM